MTVHPSDRQIPETELWPMLARYLTGESSHAEAAALERWQAHDPARAELVDALRQVLNGLAVATSDVEVDGAFECVSARLEEAEVVPFPVGERWRPPWRTTAIRAAVLAALGLGGVLVWQSLERDSPGGSAAVAARSYETRVGASDSVRLPDGSQVLLGPASRLMVAADYGQDRREVVLEGEALFEVRHDASRTFSVRAGAALIEDLGTRFTVRSTDSAEVRVAVTDGSVRLHAAGAGESIVLAAGDRGILRSDGRPVAEPGRASEADLGWTRGSLVFESASLTEVGTELRRWYGIELRIADPALRGRRLTATFQGEPAPQVLDVIARALGVQIETRADTAIVQGPAR